MMMRGGGLDINAQAEPLQVQFYVVDCTERFYRLRATSVGNTPTEIRNNITYTDFIVWRWIRGNRPEQISARDACIKTNFFSERSHYIIDYLARTGLAADATLERCIHADRIVDGSSGRTAACCKSTSR
jgi:hypothetical protein